MIMNNKLVLVLSSESRNSKHLSCAISIPVLLTIPGPEFFIFKCTLVIKALFLVATC